MCWPALVDFLVERVHLLVARDQGAGGGGVVVDKGVQRGLEHVERHPARRGRSRVIFTGGSWLKSRARLAILVASSPMRSRFWEIFIATVTRRRLAGQRRLGEQLDDQFVNLHLELVNDAVVLLDAHGEVMVALDERLHAWFTAVSAWLAIVSNFCRRSSKPASK
jgi:hypothetical protein